MFGPVAQAPQRILTFEVPLTVTEFRIAYRDSGGNVVGVYQTDVPSGDGDFTIDEPDYVDLDAFVESLAVEGGIQVLDVSESKSLKVTARLSDGSTADVSDLITVISGNSAVASTGGDQVVGVNSGSTVITVSLFNVDTTASVRVNDFVFGLLSTPDGTNPGDGDSETISISADGRYAVFDSNADNLVPGGTPINDIYLIDRSTGSIRILSDKSDGTASTKDSDGPHISGNGRYVAFESGEDLVPEDTNGMEDIYLYDIQNSSLELVSVNSSGTGAGDGRSEAYRPSISKDGRFVAFGSRATDLVANDTNGQTDIFLRDRQTGTTELISQATDGTQGNGRSTVFVDGISDNGRYVTFFGVHPIWTTMSPTTTARTTSSSGTASPVQPLSSLEPPVRLSRPTATVDERHVRRRQHTGSRILRLQPHLGHDQRRPTLSVHTFVRHLRTLDRRQQRGSPRRRQ